jgi:hypothetical protein
MTDLQTNIEKLTDQQALSILISIGGEFSDASMPESESDQRTALDALFREGAKEASVPVTAPKSEQAGAGARELLKIMAEMPALRAEVEERVAKPPVQEALAVPLVLAAPMVLTGCIVLLQVAGHLSFAVGSDGKWSVQYDPSKKAPLDDVLSKIVDRLGGLMGWSRGSLHA